MAELSRLNAAHSQTHFHARSSYPAGTLGAIRENEFQCNIIKGSSVTNFIKSRLWSNKLKAGLLPGTAWVPVSKHGVLLEFRGSNSNARIRKFLVQTSVKTVTTEILQKALGVSFQLLPFTLLCWGGSNEHNSWAMQWNSWKLRLLLSFGMLSFDLFIEDGLWEITTIYRSKVSHLSSNMQNVAAVMEQWLKSYSFIGN